MAVLLQHRHAEAVERVDVTGVVVAREVVDSLAHLVGAIVGEGDTQDVGRHYASLVYQKRETPGQGTRLARARTRDHAHVALGRGDGVQLRLVESLEHVDHARTSCPTVLLVRTHDILLRPK